MEAVLGGYSEDWMQVVVVVRQLARLDFMGAFYFEIMFIAT